jgi:hypothetical protein
LTSTPPQGSSTDSAKRTTSPSSSASQAIERRALGP